jgi:hypothetical protein
MSLDASYLLSGGRIRELTIDNLPISNWGAASYYTHLIKFGSSVSVLPPADVLTTATHLTTLPDNLFLDDPRYFDILTRIPLRHLKADHVTIEPYTTASSATITHLTTNTMSFGLDEDVLYTTASHQPDSAFIAKILPQLEALTICAGQPQPYNFILVPLQGPRAPLQAVPAVLRPHAALLPQPHPQPPRGAPGVQRLCQPGRHPV